MFLLGKILDWQFADFENDSILGSFNFTIWRLYNCVYTRYQIRPEIIKTYLNLWSLSQQNQRRRKSNPFKVYVIFGVSRDKRESIAEWIAFQIQILQQVKWIIIIIYKALIMVHPVSDSESQMFGQFSVLSFIFSEWFMF